MGQQDERKKSLPESNYQVASSVGGMLFALPVGGVNIWPILGRGIPWGNHGWLPVDIMTQTTNWVVYLVCRSFSHSEKLCMGPGPPKLTLDVSKG